MFAQGGRDEKPCTPRGVCGTYRKGGGELLQGTRVPQIDVMLRTITLEPDSILKLAK